MLTKFDKALAALLVAATVPIIIHFLPGAAELLGPGAQATIVAALAGLFTWGVPNKV